MRSVTPQISSPDEVDLLESSQLQCPWKSYEILRAPFDEPIAEPAPIQYCFAAVLRRSRIEYRTTCQSGLTARTPASRRQATRRTACESIMRLFKTRRLRDRT